MKRLRRVTRKGLGFFLLFLIGVQLFYNVVLVATIH